MVFLNPSILLGLLAASIPILIHLLNFRKLRKVEFSTLSFLKELQKSKIKKIKIKQWLLLLLRTLIIIFLVLAFARPTLETDNFIGASSSSKTSAVFLIDNSLSMKYISNSGSIFNYSKKIANEIISEMSIDDEFIIVYSSDSTFTTSNKESALNYIDNLSISLRTEFLYNKIENALQSLKESKNINKEVYIFSDFQSSTFIRTDIDSLQSEFTDSDLKFYLIDMSVENPENYSVSQLKLEDKILEQNKSLTFSAIVNNYSSNPVEGLNASLFLNDKRVAQKNLSLNGNSEKRIKFETSLTNTGYFNARVDIEEDNIVEDNQSYFSFLVPNKINILLSYQNETDIVYIEKAINSTSENNHINLVKIQTGGIISERITDFDIVIIVSSQINRSLNIENYVQSGGNILFIPPRDVTINQLNELKDFIHLPKANQIVQTSPSSNNYIEFGKVNFQHPIYSGLFDINRNQQIESPKIYKYINFDNEIGVYPVLSLINDQIFLGERNINESKIIFMSSAISLEWNNLPLKGIFAPLISRIIYYLSTSNGDNKNYVVGEPISLDVQKINFPLISVELPSGQDKFNIQNITSSKIFYNKTLELGNYKFKSNDKLISFATVNLDNRESNLVKMNSDLMNDFFTRLFGTNYSLLDKNEDFEERIKKARFGTELWKHFLILALILALIEMFIAKNTKKDIAILNN